MKIGTYKRDKINNTGKRVLRGVKKLAKSSNKSVTSMLKNNAELQRNTLKWLKTSEEVDEGIRDRLVRPWMKKIIEIAKSSLTNKNLLNSKTLKLLSAPTGVGKTFSLYTYFIPLFHAISGAKVSIILVPESSIISPQYHKDLEEQGGIETLTPKQIADMNLSYVESLLNTSPMIPNIKTEMGPGSLTKNLVQRALRRSNRNLVILTTFKNFCTGRCEFPGSGVKTKSKGELLVEYLRKEKQAFSLFIDEVHVSSTTSQENYKENMGLSTPDYSAVFSGILADIIQYNPYVFGMTATLTKEQRNVLETKMKDNGNKIEFEWLNEGLFGKELLVSRTAWVGDFEYYDTNITEHDFTAEKFYPFLEKFDKVLRELASEATTDEDKRVVRMMLRCKPALRNTRDRKRFGEILWAMQVVAKYEIEHGRGDRFSMYVMNGTIKAMLTPNQVIAIRDWDEDMTLYTKEQGLDDELIQSDLSHEKWPDARYLFVINKGVVGMDIPPLKFLVDFRPNVKDAGSDIIGDSVEQVVGRLMRYSCGFSIKGDDFDQHSDAKKWLTNGYDTTDYVRNKMSDEEFELYKLANTAHILAPEISTYVGGGKGNELGVEEKIRKKFVSLSEAIDWRTSLKL